MVTVTNKKPPRDFIEVLTKMRELIPAEDVNRLRFDYWKEKVWYMPPELRTSLFREFHLYTWDDLINPKKLSPEEWKIDEDTVWTIPVIALWTDESVDSTIELLLLDKICTPELVALYRQNSK